MIENLETRRLLSASVANGILTITGSDHADRINVAQRGAAVVVHEGKSISRFGKKDHIQQIIVNALGGNDRVTIASRLAATVDGGDGNDLIIGGAGNDLLMGGNGNDRILGQAGNDSISGGAGHDALFGGAGDDTIDSYDTEADQVAGGNGKDSARVDSPTDTAWNIENYLSVETSALGTVTVSGGTLNYTGVAAGTISDNPNINLGSIGGTAWDIPVAVFGGTLGGAGTLTVSNAVLGGSTERGGIITINGVTSENTGSAVVGNATLCLNSGLVKTSAGTLNVDGNIVDLNAGYLTASNIAIGFYPGADGVSLFRWIAADGTTIVSNRLTILPPPQPAETDPQVITATEETVVEETPSAVAVEEPATPAQEAPTTDSPTTDSVV